MSDLLNKIKYLIPAVIITIAGCMVGPDYKRPELKQVENEKFTGSALHHEDFNNYEMGRWWENFADPVTNELVNQALENNYDLKAAAARVLRARSIYQINTGKKLPQVNYDFNYDRSKRSFDFSGERFSNLSTAYQQQISASYVLDLFGKLKRAQRASWDDLLSTQANRQALTNDLIASVIKTRIDISVLNRRLEIALANTESRQKTLDIVERRYNQGLVSPVDVRLARENLESAKSQVPPIRQSLSIARHSLDVLLGKKAGKTKSIPETLSELPELKPVPVGLPADLLDRRPDLIAGEYALKAANERIGVSIAQLYPDLSLTGSYGRVSQEFEDIFIDETEIYSGVLSLVQPIFTGGQLRAEVSRNKAVYKELAADYAKTLLNALKEVEDGLVTEKELQKRMVHVKRRYKEAKAAEDLSRQRYSRGVESILLVLESERRRRIAEEEYAILRGRIWAERVNLFLALGGDWNTTDKKVGMK